MHLSSAYVPLTHPIPAYYPSHLISPAHPSHVLPFPAIRVEQLKHQVLVVIAESFAKQGKAADMDGVFFNG